MKKDLLGIDDLSRDEIYRVLETAEAMREIGKLREILIRECLKTLELLKRKPT